MLKNLYQLEHVISDKVCHFVCDHDTDINIIKEALFQFQKYIGDVEDAKKAQQAAPTPTPEQEPQTEESKPVEVPEEQKAE